MSVVSNHAMLCTIQGGMGTILGETETIKGGTDTIKRGRTL